MKKLVGEVVKDQIQARPRRCHAIVKKCFGSKDYIEGRDAFMEKRKPVFTGT